MNTPELEAMSLDELEALAAGFRRRILSASHFYACSHRDLERALHAYLYDHTRENVMRLFTLLDGIKNEAIREEQELLVCREFSLLVLPMEDKRARLTTAAIETVLRAASSH
jgi:hypothetical protein